MIPALALFSLSIDNLHQTLGPQFTEWAQRGAFFLLATVLLYLLLTQAKKLILKYIPSPSKEINPSQTEWKSIFYLLLNNTKAIFLLATSLDLTTQFFIIPRQVNHYLNHLFFIVFCIQMVFWGFTLIRFWIEHYIRTQGEDGAKVTTAHAFAIFLKIIYLTIVLLWALENFGININSLIAGLGIGGVAVALSIQKILGDLFASLTILLDKPFIIGDFVITGDYQGTIESIGLKTTRIRSLSGEQIIFSNTDLLQSRLRNIQRMTERRVSFELGVTYQTSPETLKAIPQIIQAIIEKEAPHTRFEYVFFKSYKDSALNFEVAYWVLSPAHADYRHTHQRINLSIYETFSAQKIEFAYPTQSLYLNKNTS